LPSASQRRLPARLAVDAPRALRVESAYEIETTASACFARIEVSDCGA
jgi:hypothetical protein